MNFIENANYIAQINAYINTPAKINDANENLTQIFLEKVHLSGGQNFQEQATKIFQKIGTTVPGKELMQRILNCGQELTICYEKKIKNTENPFFHSGCQFLPAFNTIMFNFDATYHLTLNEAGEKKFFLAPLEAILSHECMHFVHRAENRHHFSAILIHPELDSPEEQTTITGLSPLPSQNPEALTIGSFAISDFCCENSLLAALGYPMRINHRSVIAEPTAIDMIEYSAIGSLKELLGRSPAALNELYSHPGLSKITLLSAATYYGQNECMEYLLSAGANINQNDEIGGAFMAAIKGGFKSTKNWDLPLTLLDRGASVNLKDHMNKTALDVFNEHPTSYFCRDKKPIINRIKSMNGIISK